MNQPAEEWEKVISFASLQAETRCIVRTKHPGGRIAELDRMLDTLRPLITVKDFEVMHHSFDAHRKPGFLSGLACPPHVPAETQVENKLAEETNHPQ